jgi:hypothetical protein
VRLYVYKYFSKEEYLRSFLERGDVCFNQLSYFKNLEETYRGDKNEGILQYRPSKGLELQGAGGEPIPFHKNAVFESKIDADRIFVFCTSLIHSGRLAEELKAFACLRIRRGEFVERLEHSFELEDDSRITHRKIFEGRVTYYSITHDVGANWAQPHHIVKMKQTWFSPQKEYRFYFGFGEALSFGKTRQRLTILDGDSRPGDGHPESTAYVLTIGNTEDICKTYLF